MKAIIKEVKFSKEYETKFGTMYLHKVSYDDKVGYYSSKKKDQTYFVSGKEAEFTEEPRTGDKGEYIVIKPVKSGNFQSPAGRTLKKEQSRYSGFAVSYCKDLIVAGKLDIKQWEDASEKIFKFMVDLDKTIEV